MIWCGTSLHSLLLASVCWHVRALQLGSNTEASPARPGKPAEPGCYVLLPSGCPKRKFEAHKWTRDPDAARFSSDNSLADCEARRMQYNKWCGVENANMQFVEAGTRTVVKSIAKQTKEEATQPQESSRNEHEVMIGKRQAGEEIRPAGELAKKEATLVRHGSKVCRVPTEKKKVFIHSMPKTGTTSMGYALELLGYNDCGSRKMHDKASFPDIRVANNLVSGYKIGHLPQDVEESAKKMLRRVKKDVDGLKKYTIHDDFGHKLKLEKPVTCETYSDFPIGHATGMDLRLKMLLWPNSTYIWIDRPFEDWYRSYIEYKALHNKTSPCTVPEIKEFIAEKKQDLLDLEEMLPGSVIFLNVEKLTWRNLLAGLPTAKACMHPTENFPVVNTIEENRGDEKKQTALLQNWVERQSFDFEFGPCKESK